MADRSRRWTGGRLVIASHNAGKVREIAELLSRFAVEVVSAATLGLPEPEETADSFTGNAALKARAAASASGLPALADDSGLAVAALGGAPGVFSARWAGPGKDFAVAIARVEQMMAGQTDRSAAFICALSLVWPEGDIVTVEGRVEGQLSFPPRGENGFGYDPIFVPTGDSRCFAEMEPAEKHAISHRADAFRKLVAQVFAHDQGD